MRAVFCSFRQTLRCAARHFAINFPPGRLATFESRRHDRRPAAGTWIDDEITRLRKQSYELSE